MEYFKAETITTTGEITGVHYLPPPEKKKHQIINIVDGQIFEQIED